MNPTIQTRPEKKLIGKRLAMSLAHYTIGALWGSFMPRKNEIQHRLTEDVIGLTLYSPTYFHAFNPTAEFEKWATAEVANFDHVPADMETITLPGGLYAIFHYKGSSADMSSYFQKILGVWLPNSDYQLDDRPHVEVLGAKYKNNDPSSEEELWIPVKPK
jgi:AraC family transcriptional regulator